MQNAIVKILDKRLYPDFQDNWDCKLFRDIIIRHINSSSRVLDLGAGAGIIKQLNFRGLTSQICGVDIDDRVLKNPYLDEAKMCDTESIPYGDNSFDVVICNSVLEHLSAPEKTFKEVYRILKKGGFFIVKTPNKYHYVTILARLTPHWFHSFYNRLLGRAEEDTFPTFYRVNSQKKIVCYGEDAGFKVESIELVEGRPEYLRIIWPTYLLGAAYEKVVNSTELLRFFRIVLIACWRKL